MSDNLLAAIVLAICAIAGVVFMTISAMEESNINHAKAECAKTHSVEECIHLFEE